MEFCFAACAEFQNSGIQCFPRTPSLRPRVCSGTHLRPFGALGFEGLESSLGLFAAALLGG